MFAAAAGVVSLAAAAGWLFFFREDESGPLLIELRPDDVRFVAQGAEIYDQYCAACHGADLEGQANWRQRNAAARLPAPPHDETGHTWHHPDMALFDLTKIGPAALVGGGYESDMPGYEGVLTDQEVLAVLSYIKSTWPEDIRARHDQINERGGHR